MRNTIIAIGIMSIPSFARITKTVSFNTKSWITSECKDKGHLEFADNVQTHTAKCAFPNSRCCFNGIANAVLAEAALSYLGLGIPTAPIPAGEECWSESQVFITVSPWYAIAPGIFITLLVLGFNCLGMGSETLEE